MIARTPATPRSAASTASTWAAASDSAPASALDSVHTLEVTGGAPKLADQVAQGGRRSVRGTPDDRDDAAHKNPKAYRPEPSRRAG